MLRATSLWTHASHYLLPPFFPGHGDVTRDAERAAIELDLVESVMARYNRSANGLLDQRVLEAFQMHHSHCPLPDNTFSLLIEHVRGLVVL